MRRRAVVVVFSLLAWVSGSALGGLGPSIQAHASSSGLALGKAHAGYTPSLTGSKPVVILVVGSGARQGDDVMHSLADSLHLMFISPAKHHATVVGIPRDSYVSIAGGGTNKINSSLVFGGPDGLVQTIEAVSGVHIDYWAITTFWGLISMIGRIGGVSVDIPFSMHDSYSTANFEPGRQLLSGEQALAFTRDRHSVSSGDFGRSEDGGRLLLALLAQFQKEYRADPSRLLTWISAGLTNSFTQLPLNEVMQLAFTVTGIPMKNVQNVVLPGNAHSIGSLSVVTLDDAWKARVFSDVKPDAILTKANVPPSPTANQ
jgi:LCP family protein required for cell wall assembly